MSNAFKNKNGNHRPFCNFITGSKTIQQIMRKPFIGIFLLLSFFSRAQTKPLAGFGEKAASEEFSVEEKFDNFLNAKNIDSGIRIMSSRPHHVGSPGGKAVADYI